MTGPIDSSTGVDALVSGKRRVPRIEVRLPARVKGVHGEFSGTVHDISMDGALVRLPLRELEGAPRGPIGPAEQFALLERHFRDSFDLRFLHCDVVVETQVVRMLVTPEEEALPEPELALGCRFVNPLTPKQQSELGLTGGGEDFEPWGEATARLELRRSCDPACPVTAYLLESREGVAGPPFVGHVRAVGRSVLSVRLSGIAHEDLRELMRTERVPTRVMRGTTELLCADAEFVTARYCDRPSPGVEVLLATPVALPRAVRRCFRRV